MRTLHAYWRMEYITAPKEYSSEDQNPFLRAPKLSDKEALIIYRGPLTYLILNKFPYNSGHLLAIPYREVAQLEDLTTEESAELMATITLGKVLLQKAFQPDGVNIGFNFGHAAGAGIPSHLHCHLVPRWNGDTNFMPVLGETRVLPEALEGTWKRLVEVAASHK